MTPDESKALETAIRAELLDATVRSCTSSPKITAIKLCREKVGYGLTDAKEWVERVMPDIPMRPGGDDRPSPLQEERKLCDSLAYALDSLIDPGDQTVFQRSAQRAMEKYRKARGI